ncbi:transposase, partial [Peribacillus simplex]
NYERRFKDTDLFEQIFYRILITAADRKLISAEHVFVDSTHVKDERTKQFAYSFHAAADRNGFVLGTIVTPGNTHDSHILEPL